jgi:phospholipase A1
MGVWLAGMSTGTIAEPMSALMLQCKAIAGPEERLACYDRAADRLPAPVAAKTPDVTAAVLRESATERAGMGGMVPDAGPERQAMSAPSSSDPARAQNTQPAERDEAPSAAWLGFRPYRDNYLLLATYNENTNRDAIDETWDLPFLGNALDNVEMKFQFSFEVPVWRNLLRDDLDLYFGYTQLSFFQAYNQEYSSPFRETNYEPELGLKWRPDEQWRGWRLRSARIAANHQSNGRSEPLSRSWNRLTGEATIERDDLSLGLRLWSLLGEQSPGDNPDITRYLGYGEFRANYRFGKQRFGLMVRNPVDAAGVQLDWSYALSESLGFYVQYFNGYGESLLDYDHSVNRIGIGFSLNAHPDLRR